MNDQDDRGFWKSVGLVLSGTAIAQAIPILGSLIIARLFIPEEFGRFSVWLGFVIFIAVLCTGRYEMSLPLQGDGKPRRLGVVANLYVVFSASILVSLILAILMSLSILDGFSTELVVMLVPASALLGMSSTWQAWASADGKFHSLSKIRVLQSLAITMLQIGAGYLDPSVESLAAGQLVGVMIGVAYSAYLMPLNRRNIKGFGYRKVMVYLIHHKRFLVFSLPADAINTASAQLPLLILGAKYGVDIAGFLAMTMRALGAPVALLGRSVMDVFRRHASTSFRMYGECRSQYLQTFKVLALSSIVAMTVFYFYAEELFVFAFGAEWRMSGVIAIWMLPMFALRFVSSPLSYMLYLANKQHVDLIWQISLLVMTVSALYFLDGYKNALIAYSIGYSILYIVYLKISYNLSCGGVKHDGIGA